MASYPLVDSYLAEIGRHLPRSTRDDIVGELRSDLTEQVNERAEIEGRNPSDDDEREVLRALGHPVAVASGYKAQRYLIGPELYPAYLQTLRATVLIGLGLALLFSLVLGSAETQTLSVKGLLNVLVEIAFWIAVAVTAVFLALEASGDKLGWYKNWSPDSLRGSAPVINSDVATNLITEGFFLLLWNRYVSVSWQELFQTTGNPASFSLGEATAGDLVGLLFVPLNIIVGLFFCIHLYVLVRGSWPRWSSWFEFALCIALMACLAWLQSGAPLVTLPQGAEQLALWGNRTIAFSLWVVFAFTLWDAFLAFRRARV